MPAVLAGLLLPGMAAAVTASADAVATRTDTPGVGVSDAEAKTIVEEMVVVGEADRRIYELAETLNIAPDSADLLKRAVGANVVSNGPVTGMAQYRGMSRMRVSSRINGQFISPGGPNWMDPPLSYAPAAHLESLEVHRGIASVGAGMETIGGVVDANTWQGRFAEAGNLFEGRIRAGANTVNDAGLLSGAFVVSNQNHRLKLSGLTEQADDASFADGEILPTEYDRSRFDVGYGLRFGRHEFQLDYGRNETGDAGTPALPMDIEYIDSDLAGFGYRFVTDGWHLDSRLWWSQIDHGMTNYHLRTPPADPGRQRRNTTDVENLGFSVVLDLGGWRLGVDGHDEVHNSDIDNPNNPMFFVANFNEAERRLLGVFAEKQFRFRDSWQLELGGRYNRVESDAKEVNATPAMLGMPPAVALRNGFNDADRSIADDNVDLVLKLRYEAADNLSYYLGAARKTRAPSYQERYLWLPLQATAGLADGRTYTGNLDLDSEVAAEIEIGFDLDSSAVHLSPRLFYRDVSDYIQGGQSTNTAAILFVRMMNMMNGTNAPDPLEFQNVDAEFYGFDVDWGWQLSERWALSGVLNYVRGKTDDDNVYRIPPLNGLVALNYATDRWGAGAEAFFAGRQDEVAVFNGEPETAGYAVYNLHGHWQMSGLIRLSVGVENLTDKVYSDHLAGISRVGGNPDVAVGDRLPGFGRNVFARVDLTF